jgi:tetratricopeptide (TPR) repeat protein
MRLAAFMLAFLLPLALAEAAPPPAKPAPVKPAPRPPLETLFDQLHQAGSPEEAKPLESQIEAFFLRSGSPSVDLLMARASTALTAGDKPVARKLYDAVTAVAPAYAEGWHRRALLLSDAGDDTQAMASLQRTIQLNPRHFEAMMQLGEMLEDYGDKPGALKLYRRALALDPQLEGLQRHIDGLSRSVEGEGI